MKRKIVIAGGTGFIGSYLKNKLAWKGFEVLIISRRKNFISWDDEKAIINGLENAEALINMSGKSVDCRYNEKNKKLILQSRVKTTRVLQEAMEKCINPPKIWINSSTATIYRHAEDREMDEETGEIGSGFSVEVAKAWEKEFFRTPIKNTRKVALRTAIVLGKNGGVMIPYKNLVKYGLGGPQGRGKQMFSWIHIEDFYRIIVQVISDESMSGIYNAAAPKPITNKVFMKEMQNILKPPVALPSPKFLLSIGACFIKTETELILKSRWVVPSKLLKQGFVFQYPDIKTALVNILSE